MSMEKPFCLKKACVIIMVLKPLKDYDQNYNVLIMCFQGIWQQSEPDCDPELRRINFRPLNNVIGKEKFDLIKCKTQLKNEIRIKPTFEVRKTAPYPQPIVSIICDASELRNLERTNQVLS